MVKEDTVLATELKPPPTKQLLRFSTAGSVDDGKSTLIGRLLHDSQSLYSDQIAHLETKTRQGETPNWALLTDGLKAEREQGITIDVAYRYFATQTRKYIIADTPGHEQYTRNMATGASTADLTIILVDARKGLRTQSRRHAYIASLMGIPNIVVAVNKMDAVDYAAETFVAITESFGSFMRSLGLRQVQYVPISALVGDNVVAKSEAMAWYEGPTLLEILESAPTSQARQKAAFRFPVQQVVRPNQDYRGYAGQVASGQIRPGSRVLALPSRKTSIVKAVQLFGEHLSVAKSGMSVILELEDELDISRGDMLVLPNNPPNSGRDFEAMLVWFSEMSLQSGKTYLLKHTTQTVRISVDQLLYRSNIDTLAKEEADALNLNQIGRVRIRSFTELHTDPYQENRHTGSFILVDPEENHTLAAGMIVPGSEQDHASERAIVLPVSEQERRARLGHPSLCIWLVGATKAVREQVSIHFERQLFERGLNVIRLNGGRVLPGIPREQARLAFGALTRVVSLFLDAGMVVIAWQDQADDYLHSGTREKIPAEKFLEVHMVDDLEVVPSRSENHPWHPLSLDPSQTDAFQKLWNHLLENPLFPLNHP